MATKSAARSRQLDPRALDAYLPARFHSDRQTEADLHRSISGFEQAIAIDPDYGQADAGLAQAWWGLSTAMLPPRSRCRRPAPPDSAAGEVRRRGW